MTSSILYCTTSITAYYKHIENVLNDSRKVKGNSIYGTKSLDTIFPLCYNIFAHLNNYSNVQVCINKYIYKLYK